MDLGIGRLVVLLVLAVTPALLQLWWARALARGLADPALPERLLAHRQRRLFVCLFAGAALATMETSAVWWTLPGLGLSSMAAAYPLRRTILDETWTLGRYLGFFLRLALAVWGFWFLLAGAPAIVMAWGDGPWQAALWLGVVLTVWNLTYSQVLRAIMRATPLASGPTYDAFQQMVDAAQLPPVHLEQVAVTGGCVANAIALPATRGPAVVVSSTLLERLDPSEVRAILAHELAHIEHYTPRRLRRRGLAIMGLGLVGVSAAPIAAAMVPGTESVIAAAWPIVVTFALAALMRHRQQQETDSDRRAVALCGDAPTLMRALEKIHALALVPRRWAADVERKASHPSLARRLKDIAAAAGHPTPVLAGSETFAAADGSATVIFHRDRLEWTEGATAVFTVDYGQLSGVRVHATAGRAVTLDALDGKGRRWTMPLAPDDVARAQRTLDRVDARLAGTPATAHIPVDPAFAQAAGLLCAAVAACGGLLSIVIVALAALKPSPARLWATAAAGVSGAGLTWVWPTLLPRGAAWVAPALALAAAIVGLIAFANRRHVPLVGEPRVTAIYTAGAALLLALVAGSGLDPVSVRATVITWPSAVVFPIAAATMLAVGSPRRVGVPAAALLALVGTTLAGVGTRTYVDRFVTDAFSSRGRHDVTRVGRVSAPHLLWETRDLANVEDDLWVSPSGRTIAYSLVDDEGRERIEIRDKSAVLRRLEGMDAAYVDDDRLALVHLVETVSTLRVVDIATGREAWRVALPGTPSAFRVEPSGRWGVLTSTARGDFLSVTGTAGDAPRVHRWPGRPLPLAMATPVLAADDVLLALAQRYDTGFDGHWIASVLAAAGNGSVSTASLWRLAEVNTETVRSGLDVDCVPSPLGAAAVCAAFDGVDTHLSSVATSAATPSVRNRIEGRLRFFGADGEHVRAWLDYEPVVLDTASLSVIRPPRTREHRPHLVAASAGAMAVVGSGTAGTSTRVYARP
jgi:Zn-dependent protease with chaperone function